MHFDISLFCSGLKQEKENLWTSPSSLKETFPTDVHNLNFHAEKESFWFRHRANCVSVLIKQFFSPHLFFDIGGGTGFVAEAISKTNNIPVVVVEPHPEVKNIVPNRSGVSLIHGHFEDLQILDESLPSVGLFDVLEHVEDDEGFLNKIIGKMRPGGKIIITVPAHEFLWSMEDENAGHFRRYDLKELVHLLERKKLNIEYSGFLFSFLILPILLFRTLPTRLGFRKSGEWQSYQQDHKMNSFFSSLISLLSSWELRLIKNKNSVPLGSSLVICAQKRP